MHLSNIVYVYDSHSLAMDNSLLRMRKRPVSTMEPESETLPLSDPAKDDVTDQTEAMATQDAPTPLPEQPDETSLPQLKLDLPLRPPLPEKRADNYDPNEVPTHNVETIESYIRAAGLCDRFNGIPVQCCRRTTIRLSFHSFPVPHRPVGAQELVAVFWVDSRRPPANIKADLMKICPAKLCPFLLVTVEVGGDPFTFVDFTLHKHGKLFYRYRCVEDNSLQARSSDGQPHHD